MADYPTTQDSGAELIQSRARRLPFDGTETKRATSGKPRIRSFFSQTWYEFEITHEGVDHDDTAVSGHYTAHETISFSFTYDLDNTSYTVQYAGEPVEAPARGEYKTITTKLIQVA